MWIKKLDELRDHLKDDGKYHDIQIINNVLYLDGTCVYIQTPQFDETIAESYKEEILTRRIK